MPLPRRPALPRVRPPDARLPRVSRSTLALGIVLLAAGAIGAYGVARQSSIFELRGVEVEGAPKDVQRAVARALAPLEGTSLVDLDREAARALAERVPSVRGATVDRDFPGTLRVSVSLERPVAVLRRGAAGWLVAESGRVVRELDGPTLPGLPRIWLQATEAALVTGSVVPSPEIRSAIRAIARLPKRFPMQVLSAKGTEEDLTIVLGGFEKAELRLGEAQALRLKLEVAARVLRTLTRTERRELAYLDVSVPERPVAGIKPQVELST